MYVTVACTSSVILFCFTAGRSFVLVVWRKDFSGRAEVGLEGERRGHAAAGFHGNANGKQYTFVTKWRNVRSFGANELQGHRFTPNLAMLTDYFKLKLRSRFGLLRVHTK